MDTSPSATSATRGCTSRSGAARAAIGLGPGRRLGPGHALGTHRAGRHRRFDHHLVPPAPVHERGQLERATGVHHHGGHDGHAGRGQVQQVGLVAVPSTTGAGFHNSVHAATRRIQVEELARGERCSPRWSGSRPRRTTTSRPTGRPSAPTWPGSTGRPGAGRGSGGPRRGRWGRRAVTRARRRRRGQASSASRAKALVLVAGVGPVLELDDAELAELLAQPGLASSRRRRAGRASCSWARSWRTAAAGTSAARATSSPATTASYTSTPMRSHTSCCRKRSRMRTAASNANSWRSRISAPVSSVVVLLEAKHAEGHVAGLVAHHVAQQLLEQRLGGQHGA